MFGWWCCGFLTPCSRVGGYQRFGGTCFFHIQGVNWGDKFLRNVGKYLQDNTAPQRRGMQSEVSFDAIKTVGGLVVTWTGLDPKFAGSNPAEDNGFLRVIKILCTTSFGGEVKSSVPCRRFTACKRNLRACFVSKIQRSRFSPMSLLLRC
jgi:hypothetical protein